MRHRAVAYGVSAVVLVATLWPPFRDPPADSFPLSTYPMFSVPRDREVEVSHLLAVTSDGRRLPLAPGLASGDFEVLQAQAAIRGAILEGRPSMERLCDAAARRLAGRRDMADVVHLELATSLFDVLRYFGDGAAPLARLVHFRCEAAP